MYKKLEWLAFILFLQFSFAGTNINISKFYHISNVDNYQQVSMNVTNSLGHEYSIMTHRWTKGSSRLMVMAHGYIDNCGYVKPLQRFFLNSGFDILCIELPGHGLSSGDRADVDDFITYKDIYKHVFQRLPQGYDENYFYGHSTGAVGMLDLLLAHEPHPFEKIILAAPLVRSHLWSLSKFGMKYFGFLIKRLPTRRLSLHDREYKELLQIDPTLIKSTPKSWFPKLVNWNKGLVEKDNRSSEDVITIFAGKDSVIDQKYNEKFYRKTFSNLKVFNIPNSDHAFHYESETNKKIFYSILNSIL